MSWYRWQGDTLQLALRVQPRAREDAFGEPLGDELRVRLKAPPVDGKANAGLVDFLARAFGVPKARVRLERGEHGRSKVVAIDAPQVLPKGLVIRTQRETREATSASKDQCSPTPYRRAG